MEFKIKGDSMDVEKGPEYDGLFQLMVDNVVTYADPSRTPVPGDQIVVVRDGLTTIEHYIDQASDAIAGVVVPKPE